MYPKTYRNIELVLGWIAFTFLAYLFLWLLLCFGVIKIESKVVHRDVLAGPQKTTFCEGPSCGNPATVYTSALCQIVYQSVQIPFVYYIQIHDC